ncbi:hypothetical protein C8R44DRAFT_886798 [Mycena epipterygia]|nr:hypothetical protein C8R44DRAFT_886798 [Mycena epipterygia]
MLVRYVRFILAAWGWWVGEAARDPRRGLASGAAGNLSLPAPHTISSLRAPGEPIELRGAGIPFLASSRRADGSVRARKVAAALRDIAAYSATSALCACGLLQAPAVENQKRYKFSLGKMERGLCHHSIPTSHHLDLPLPATLAPLLQSIYKKSHRNIINWRFSAFMLGEGSPKPHRFASAAFTAGAKPLRWRWPFPLARGLSLGRSLSADAGLFRWRGAFLLFFLFYVKSLFLARCAEHFRSPLGPLCRAFSLAAGPAAQSFTLAARPTAWCRPTSGVYTVNVIDSVMGAPDASRR